MKKLLLLVLAVSFGLYATAQERVIPSKAQRDRTVKMATKAVKDTDNPNGTYIPGSKGTSLLVDTQVGGTQYDLQTNASCQNRINLFDDGTIGVVWTMGLSPTAFPERGTGYNYYDGNAWGDQPTARIENVRTGWPSYAPYGENGEVVVNHTDVAGLWVGHRDQKGTGTWTSSILPGPPGVVDVSWPRVMTTGVNRDVIHTIYCTWPDSGPYMGQQAVLLYSRSSDGGTTWDIDNHFFDELGPNYYTTMNGDIYEFADSKNGSLAFLVGDNWMDLVLMKSMDDGETWEKTIIWNCPYPLHVTGEPTDSFFCADGAHALAFDQSGLVHVVFGINWTYADASGTYYRPLQGGVGYWNETRPTFSNALNALNYLGEPGTELIDDYSLIGYPIDVDGDGIWNVLNDAGTYFLGACSMPQITIDDQNRIFVVHSDITENADNGVQEYRRLWERSSFDLGETWGEHINLTSGFLYSIDECVFPSVSPTSDDNIYIEYQADHEPGLAVRGDLDDYGDNFIRVMKVAKTDLGVGINDNKQISNSLVSQNYPNPFSGSTNVYVMLDKPATMTLEVSNLTGQVVYTVPEKLYPAGKAEFTIDGSKLSSGVYFYTVKTGDQSVTKKMMVK